MSVRGCTLVVVLRVGVKGSMNVVKRDGTVVPWDGNKIRRAVLGAAGGVGYLEIDSLIDRVWGRVCSGCEQCSIEDISDAVCEELLDDGVRERYSSYRRMRSVLRDVRVQGNNGALVNYVVHSKYARPGEEWVDVCRRVIGMHERFLSDRGLLGEEERAMLLKSYAYMASKRVCGSMRGMQFGGDAVLGNHARLYNCSSTYVDRVGVFGEVFYLLLCGCGVGYSVENVHVSKLPLVGTIDRSRVVHKTIDDTIEGWAYAADYLVRSFMDQGSWAFGSWVEFDYSCIRGEGSPLVTSGGLAPGHLPLRSCLEWLRSFLTKMSGRRLRSIHAHDMLCRLAQAVLAGGIRRSALISVFDYWDTEMFYCKEEYSDLRAMANNSCRVSCFEQVERVVRHSLSSFGEPGYLWDPNHAGHMTNPCGEIGMMPRLVHDDGSTETGFSFCNLTEVNCAGLSSYGDPGEEFLERVRVGAFLGTLQAMYTSMPFLGGVTEGILARDRLLGVGLTGIMDSLSIVSEHCSTGAAEVLSVNEYWSLRWGIEPCARGTCVKPSGTASIALGCVGNGVHPHFARRYIRRVRANVGERAYKCFAASNPHMIYSGGLMFPVEINPSSVTLDEMNGVEHLEVIWDIYRDWVMGGDRAKEGFGHNVSCTVSVDPSEVDDCLSFIKDHPTSALAFAPPLGDYRDAPFEAVKTLAQENVWRMLIEGYREVDYSSVLGTFDAGGACDGDKCVV